MEISHVNESDIDCCRICFDDGDSANFAGIRTIALSGV